jgi:hypothetical protein
MAKNRNRERGKQSRQAAGGSHGAGTDTMDKPDSRITPAEAGHKGRPRRFGHN